MLKPHEVVFRDAQKAILSMAGDRDEVRARQGIVLDRHAFGRTTARRAIRVS